MSTSRGGSEPQLLPLFLSHRREFQVEKLRSPNIHSVARLPAFRRVWSPEDVLVPELVIVEPHEAAVEVDAAGDGRHAGLEPGLGLVVARRAVLLREIRVAPCEAVDVGRRQLCGIAYQALGADAAVQVLHYPGEGRDVLVNRPATDVLGSDREGANKKVDKIMKMRRYVAASPPSFECSCSNVSLLSLFTFASFV
ncbi:hypothetical protein RJ639_034059 [Escallonia herrerae]|uniref:Uncharacterized protein n=1 Tax=Escallonia herrerae TaxID=1293975 RepID=A0AA88WWJ7_9ASTE|nr:hypothetical protein RJ639_034059 [Escallonia herrerae]